MKFHPNQFLSAALRDPLLLTGVATDVDAMLEAAERHGVAPLLVHRAVTANVPVGPLADRLRAHMAAHVAAAVVQDRESIRMLGRLAQAGIPHAVLKGLALAHTVYPQPWMRPRSDTDLLVRGDDLQRVDELLRDDGYQVVHHVPGELILGQRHYGKSDPAGVWFEYDVHWRLTASHVLADAPPDREVWEHLQPVQRLGGALTVAAPHALMIACVHRLAHHYGDPRLIWLWDIRLLLESMSHDELEYFGRLAQRTAVTAAACGRSLETARDLGGAVVPPILNPLLKAAATSDRAAFLWSNPNTRLHHLVGELRSMPLRRGLRVAREHLLPSLAYMRQRYPAAPRLLLPLMYPWRLMVGVPRWLSGR